MNITKEQIDNFMVYLHEQIEQYVDCWVGLYVRVRNGEAISTIVGHATVLNGIMSGIITAGNTMEASSNGKSSPTLGFNLGVVIKDYQWSMNCDYGAEEQKSDFDGDDFKAKHTEILRNKIRTKLYELAGIEIQEGLNMHLTEEQIEKFLEKIKDLIEGYIDRVLFYILGIKDAERLWMVSQNVASANAKWNGIWESVDTFDVLFDLYKAEDSLANWFGDLLIAENASLLSEAQDISEYEDIAPVVKRHTTQLCENSVLN